MSIATRHLLRVWSSPEEVIADVVDAISDFRGRIGSSGQKLVVPGGTTGAKLFLALAESSIDWGGLHLSLSDERIVPFGGDNSNASALADLFLARLARPTPEVVWPCAPGERDPSAEVAGSRLAAWIDAPGEMMSVLGIGADGHTASLFSEHSEPLQNREPSVIIRRAGEEFSRVSLSVFSLARSKRLVFILFGRSKAEALANLLGPLKLNATSPVRRILDSHRGRAIIICDEESMGKASEYPVD
jgi:6-phosphogluconolactonase